MYDADLVRAFSVLTYTVNFHEADKTFGISQTWSQAHLTGGVECKEKDVVQGTPVPGNTLENTGLARICEVSKERHGDYLHKGFPVGQRDWRGFLKSGTSWISARNTERGRSVTELKRTFTSRVCRAAADRRRRRAVEETGTWEDGGKLGQAA